MAFVLKENGQIRAFGNSQAVGQGKSNQWTDCMLVLYLLYKRAAYTLGYPSGIGVPNFDPNKDFTNIKLVSAAVRHFQNYEASRGFRLKVDGKVHCPQNWFDNTKLYTIQHLNRVYQAAVITHFNNQADPFELALDDHGMHPILRGQLIASSVFEGVL